MNRIILIVSLVALGATPAVVQEPKAEVGVFAGWVFSSGISGNNYLAPDGNVYNMIDPKSSFGWGSMLVLRRRERRSGRSLFTPGFYSHQGSTLEVSGTATRNRSDGYSHLPRRVQLGTA